MPAMWHPDDPQDGILTVHIDRQDRPVNALSRTTLEELAELLGQLRVREDLRGVLFISKKPGNFIAGADIQELQSLATAEDARQISEYGQQVFAELESLQIPTVALISGACLGGGLEFAMACRYRLADHHTKTSLGLPEVQLGIIPAWGGTVRLPRRIGLIDALPMILTGKTLNGYQARSRGLVHDVVPTEGLHSAGQRILKTLNDYRIRKVAESKLFRPRKQSMWKRFLNSNRVVRGMILNSAEKRVLKTTHGHYPAPQRAIVALRAGLESDALAFGAESQAVADLAENSVTAELIRLFFLQEAGKKPPEGFRKLADQAAVNQGAVVGAGAMGAGIALLMARKGIWTRLKDLTPEFVSTGMQAIRKSLKSQTKRRRMTPLQADQALDHISPATDYRGLQNADIVIEAIVEELDVKRQVFGELAEATNERTVLATNTSSLRVCDIAQGIPHPERIVGLHFFNPPHRMPLVEVIRAEQSSPESVATALALSQRLGKTMIVVGDCPGFLVNRLLAPYMNEAGYLLTELADPLAIERAAIEFGMPMGPLELTDLVGLQVAGHVAQNMFESYGERMQPAPIWGLLEEAPENGKSPLKSILVKKRRGKEVNRHIARQINRYRKDQGLPDGQTVKSKTIMKRLVYPLINEAAICLAEGIVETEDQIDLAMVFGTGFAPFRGGPMRFARSVGLEKIVASLNEFAVLHPRLAPSEALQQLANGEASQSDASESSLGQVV